MNNAGKISSGITINAINVLQSLTNSIISFFAIVEMNLQESLIFAHLLVTRCASGEESPPPFGKFAFFLVIFTTRSRLI